MEKSKALLLLCIAFFSLLLTSCKQEDDVTVVRSRYLWVDKTVAVVCPQDNANTMQQLERTAQWFLENFEQAQLFGDTIVRLHLQWYDETADNIDTLSSTLAADTAIVAIVGPFRSANLEIFAQACQQTGKPLIAPTATSEEIIRRHAVHTKSGNKDEQPFLWSLTETDVAFSEVLLSAFATESQQVYKNHTPTALVLSPANVYGKTFFDWIPFQAENLGIQVKFNEQYTDDDHLAQQMTKILKTKDIAENYDNSTSSFCVLQQLSQLCQVARLRRNWYLEWLGKAYPDLVRDFYDYDHPDFDLYTEGAEIEMRTWFALSNFSQEDIDALSREDRMIINHYQGFTPYADPTTGFELSYTQRFGTMPTLQECKFYDGLMLAAFACYHTRHLAPSQVGNTAFNQAIYDLTFPNRDVALSASVWSPTAMQLFLRSLASGKAIQFRGASGNISFDPETCTPATGTTYAHWRIKDGRLKILNYFSSSNNHRSSKASAAWNYLYDEHAALARLADIAQDEDPNVSYPTLTAQYAVLVHGSTGFANYRHLADVLNIYQHLRRGGLDDDHIILIADSSAAFSQRNPEPGIVRTSPHGPDLLQGVQIDYDAAQLSPADVAAILQGQRSQRLPTVLPPSAGHNVLFYWSGHGHSQADGGTDEFAWRSNPHGQGFTRQLLQHTVQHMQQAGAFRKLLVVAEPCYSEAVARAVEGVPGVLAITGASSTEQSWADNWNREGSFWMSDRFSSNLVNALVENSQITYRDLYLYCAQHTLGSHVCIINAANFGNLYHNGPKEFVITRNRQSPHS